MVRNERCWPPSEYWTRTAGVPLAGCTRRPSLVLRAPWRATAWATLIVGLQRRAGRGRIEAAVAPVGIEHVLAAAIAHLRLGLGDLEMVAAFLQVLPEGHVRVVPELGDVLGRHPERIGLELDLLLAAR